VGDQHRVRQTSLGEYYHDAGFKSAAIKRAKFDHANKQGRDVIAATPSMKTSLKGRYMDSCVYQLTHIGAITEFYDKYQWRNKLNFSTYRKKQSALAEISKRLLTRSKKYNVELLKKTKSQVASDKPKWKPNLPIDQDGEENRPIIIAYGGANIRNLRGNVSPPAKLVKKAVFRFARQRNRHVPTYATIVNEYLTSQICPLCHKRTTENVKDSFGQKLYPVLKCKNCDTRYNRDHMASCNIREVFLHMAKNNNERPRLFKDAKYKEN
jgi:transposase